MFSHVWKNSLIMCILAGVWLCQILNNWCWKIIFTTRMKIFLNGRTNSIVLEVDFFSKKSYYLIGWYFLVFTKEIYPRSDSSSPNYWIKKKERSEFPLFSFAFGCVMPLTRWCCLWLQPSNWLSSIYFIVYFWTFSFDLKADQGSEYQPGLACGWNMLLE